jgi:mono/diheme cytochrome c family protein
VTAPSRALVLLASVVLLPLYAFVDARAVPHRAHRTTLTVWDSVFSADQAARGQATYGRTCSRCHQPSLGGADESPALAGGSFMSNWNGHTMYELHDRVMSSMPTDTPGSYKREDVADVLAYVLSVNGFPAGKKELANTDSALKSIAFVSTKP